MSLSTLFNPKSIAVIGASTSPGAVGHTIVQNLLEEHFLGKVFPVNPKTDTLLGIPCYANIGAIQENIDLAIIVVPAAIVPGVFQEVATAGVKNAIIISAGFREAGVNGKVLEKQIEEIAQTYNITLLGPNCLGFLHASRSLNASFATGLPKPGTITFFSQSGALCTTLLDETRETLGYAHIVSIGNKVTLKETELLEYFLADTETHTLAFYTEDIQDANALITVGQSALLLNPPKPIIALKSGRTDAGSVASSSHTGAVAGSDHAYDTLFKQAYITRAESLTHLTALLTVFSQNRVPEGNQLSIITNAGGMGVLATDEAIKQGLTLAQLAPNTLQDLSLRLPGAAGTNNPVDVLGDASADRYDLALKLVAADPNTQMILVIVTPQAMTEAEKTAEAIIKMKESCSKPIVAVFTKGRMLDKGVQKLTAAGVATLYNPEEAVQALAAYARIKDWQVKASSEIPSTYSFVPAVETVTFETEDETGYLEESVTRHALEQAGFTFPKTTLITSKQEIESAQNLFTSSVALKIMSPDIIHKSDVGGVLLSVDPEAIAENYEILLENVQKNVPDAKIEGVLIAEMVPSSHQEILLGIKTEPGLGKLIVVGMGGIYVEVLHDITSRFAPVNTKSAENMITELRSASLLTGARGQTGIDVQKLAQLIISLSEFALQHPEVQELDINPLVVKEDGTFLVLDARIKVSN